MSDELLDSFAETPVTTNPIDNFFKVYLIFHSIALVLSFLLSIFNAPDNAFIRMFFNFLVFGVIGFDILYVVFLIIKKKGGGRIIMNLINVFALLVVAIGFVFFFARWPYRSEMLTTGLLTVPFLVFVQLIYELVVRKDNTKFLNIISFGGISVFSTGVLFFLQHWPYASEMLITGGGITFVMIIVHSNFVLKKEPRYQIHVRYLAQCIYAVVSSVMLVLVQ